MRILNFLRKDFIHQSATKESTWIYKLYAIFNKHAEELLQYEQDILRGFVPSKGYFFLDNWIDWLNANNSGYFFASSHQDKVRNIKARFKFSKTNTLAGLYLYLQKVGYEINTSQPDASVGFPLNFPHPFSNLAGNTNGISVLHGTQFSNTYPNGEFATESEAKLSLIVYYPEGTTQELKDSFSKCLEEVVCVQIQIRYVQL